MSLKRVSTLKVASSTSLLSVNRHHGKQEQTPEVVKHVKLAKERQEKRVALQLISRNMLKLLGFAKSDATKISIRLSTVCRMKWFCDSNIKTPKVVDRSKDHENGIHENGPGDSVEEDMAKAC